MIILQQKKTILDNDVTTRKNPDSSLAVYLIAPKVAQFILVAENMR